MQFLEGPCSLVINKIYPDTKQRKMKRFSFPARRSSLPPCWAGCRSTRGRAIGADALLLIWKEKVTREPWKALGRRHLGADTLQVHKQDPWFPWASHRPSVSVTVSTTYQVCLDSWVPPPPWGAHSLGLIEWWEKLLLSSSAKRTCYGSKGQHHLKPRTGTNSSAIKLLLLDVS